MEKKIPLTLVSICFVLLFNSVITVLAQDASSVSVTRDLPVSYEIGVPVQVSLTVSIKDSGINALGIEENLPAGWELQSSSPVADKTSDNKLEWLFWEMGKPVQNMEIVYTVTPASDSGTFDGKWMLAGGGTDIITGDIAGDTNIVAGEAGTGQAPPFNEILLAALIVIVLVIIASYYVLRREHILPSFMQ